MLHLFCKGVPFDFFFFAYFISPLSSFGWLKMTKTLSIQKVLLSTKLPTSDSFRLGEGGEGVVFANYTVCVWVVFYAVVKLVGGHIYTVVQKENSWFEAAKKKKKKVFERPPLTNTSPTAGQLGVMLWSCYVGTVTTLFPFATWTLGFMGSVSDQFVDMSCPEGKSRNGFEVVGRRGRHSIGHIFQPVNLIPLHCFFTSRWQTVQRFSWVYYKEWKQ